MIAKKDTKPIRYLYRFRFPNGVEKEFEILLHPETLELLGGDQRANPEWTKLKYSQCENCPLPESVEYCPVAVNLSRLVEAFRDENSYDEALVTVEAPQRTYVKSTTLQKGLSAIIGIYMVTSDCPVMMKLRPMTRFHLPFASAIETFFRSISSYLTAQFVLMRKGREPDWSLKKLVEIYREVNVVNRGISDRLLNASKKDANVNAVVILHSFGDGLTYFVESGLDDLEKMFAVFLAEGEHSSASEPRSDTLAQG